MIMVLIFVLLCFMLVYAEDYVIHRAIQRSPIHFTQGLFFDSPKTLIESTGLYGKSVIQRIDATNGETLSSYSLNSSYFGEGCAMLNNKIYQLTWREHKCFVYDTNLTLIEVKNIMPEITTGWGLTTDSKYLFVSDGSTRVFIIDPNKWVILRNFSVAYPNGRKVSSINELEYVDGYIYANVFTSNNILKFDSMTGIISKIYNMSDLATINKAGYNHTYRSYYHDYYNNVLNGIAYNKETGKFYVTGKRWNYIFEVKFL